MVIFGECMQPRSGRYISRVEITCSHADDDHCRLKPIGKLIRVMPCAPFRSEVYAKALRPYKDYGCTASMAGRVNIPLLKKN